MNTSFMDMIAVFVHCYQDDIFVYLDTLEEHMMHLELVFQRLCKLKLYLSDNLTEVRYPVYEHGVSRVLH